jgi:hypothetical protein
VASNEGLFFQFLQHHTVWPKGVAELSFTARIVLLMRDVRDMRDERDGPNGASLMDSQLRVSNEGLLTFPTLP